VSFSPRGIGEIIADLATSGAIAHAISRFAIGRFAAGAADRNVMRSAAISARA
jgi:hypothetical protein